MTLLSHCKSNDRPHLVECVTKHSHSDSLIEYFMITQHCNQFLYNALSYTSNMIFFHALINTTSRHIHFKAYVLDSSLEVTDISCHILAGSDVLSDRPSPLAQHRNPPRAVLTKAYLLADWSPCTMASSWEIPFIGPKAMGGARSPLTVPSSSV